MLKQFKVNIMMLFWSRFSETGEITAVFLAASKNFNVAMHADVKKSIWFILGILIDVIELYILMLV